MTREQIAQVAQLIRPGVRFSTAAEDGCIATSVVEGHGVYLSFDATDSDGVECSFSVRQVTTVNGQPVGEVWA